MAEQRKDASGFTPQERHDIIMAYLQQANKPDKVFHLRWKPGEMLTGKVLESTPMFWYMKYRWSRSEIEEMFYKGRCVIGPLFDQALQQTYGGAAGARWRGAVPDRQKSEWREREAEKRVAWQAEQAKKLAEQERLEKERTANVAKQRADADRLRKEAEKTLAFKSKDIWNAVSDFGADKSIDYRTFSDNLRDRGINVSPLLAKQLFDQLADKQGQMTRGDMEALIKRLDAMNQAAANINPNISIEMIGSELGAMTVMKRVLIAAGTGEPFNVDDFVFASKLGVTIQPIQYLNKLADRDVPWDDRMRALEDLAANLGQNPLFNNVLAKGNIPDLLCGWATQITDEKPEVQKKAIETVAGVFHQALVFGDKDIAVGYLEEVLDNLFRVLDDPNATKNHPAAQKAIAQLVDEILTNGDPESVLTVSHILAEKCDIENAVNPRTRETAMTNLQRIMFGANNPIAKELRNSSSKSVPSNVFHNLPPPGSVHREWLDIGSNKLPGPSHNYATTAPKAYKDTDSSRLPNRLDHTQQILIDPEQKQHGDGDADTFLSPKRDPGGPYAHLTSNPSVSRPMQPVDFDASKSHDFDNDPCKSFLWDFGDDSPNVTTKGPYTTHPYKFIGSYPVTVTVTDKYGKQASASVQQLVIDPKDPHGIGPPYAQLTDNPPVTRVNEPAEFDAAKSHDWEHKPCVNFVFDFGDGTRPLHSDTPKVKHAYEKRGAYPVSVVVTDKHGQKAKASLTHRVIDPELPDPTGPTANIQSTPNPSRSKEPVVFDASKSVDCDGDPVRQYVWDFGDNSPKVTTNTATTTHPYKTPGNYPVTVTVTDKYGKTANAGLTQKVKDPNNPNGPPSAALDNIPPVSDIDEPVTFDASKSHDFQGNPCVKFVWDFGDGSPKKTTPGPITQHPYAESGTYPVSVTVSDKQGQQAKASVTQRVRPPDVMPSSWPTEQPLEPPYVTVSSTPTKAKPKQPVKFDASKSKDFLGDPCKNYVWDFGDGTPLVETTTPVTNHAYAEPGTYPVRVTAVDQFGQKGTAKLSQLVTDPKHPNDPLPPYAAVTSTPNPSRTKQPVKFDASKSHDQFGKPVVSYLWDFGDGSPKVTTTTPVTNHAYANPATYPVRVTVTDKNGLSAQAGLAQKVRDPPEPQPEDPYAVVRSEPNDPKSGQPVRLDASDSVDQDGDPCKNYIWDFGNSSPPVTTSTPVINHVFDTPGSYPVKVTAIDKYGRKGKAHLTQKVVDPTQPASTKIGPPTAKVRSSPQEALVQEPVAFDASESKDWEGLPVKSYLWDFGDHSPKVTTTTPYTTHPYAKPGTYPVTVMVTDKHKQTASAGLNQRVRQPGLEDPAVFLNNEPPVSRPHQPVTMDASESVDMDGDPCRTFVFDFGDGTPPFESHSSVVTHPYKEPGTYPVHVTATDKYGRKGNASVNQRVIDPKNPTKIGPPTAHVKSDPPVSRPKQPVKFDASKSKDFENKPCVKFVWDFGDNSPKVTTTQPHTIHPYAKPGAYPVNVTVTDKHGQTANAGLTQRVADPPVQDTDPARGPKGPTNKTPRGPKGKQPTTSTDPRGVHGKQGRNQGPMYPVSDEKTEPAMPPDVVGDEFRNVVHDAVSKAIMDPNPKNQTAATKTATVMASLDPSFTKGLDPEAKRRYEWGLKPTGPRRSLPPNRPPPKQGSKGLHPVQFEAQVDVGNPILPDI